MSTLIQLGMTYFMYISTLHTITSVYIVCNVTLPKSQVHVTCLEYYVTVVLEYN